MKILVRIFVSSSLHGFVVVGAFFVVDDDGVWVDAVFAELANNGADELCWETPASGVEGGEVAALDGLGEIEAGLDGPC